MQAAREGKKGEGGRNVLTTEKSAAELLDAIRE
jgi:hypothetical protein